LSGQLTAQGMQPLSQSISQLGAIHVLQPKGQQGTPVNRGFQQPQPMQILNPTPGQNMQQQPQGIQGMGGLHQMGGMQIPTVQVVQQYPGFSAQMNQPPQKQNPLGFANFQPAGNQGGLGMQVPGHQTGTMFSNSNQRGGFNQGRNDWNHRDRNDRNAGMRGRARDRMRRDDRG